jgi:predicted RNase H-like HicB family nuclease
MTNAVNVAVFSICFAEQNGIVRAYSPELPSLHVCGKSRESVVADLPEVLRMYYKLNHGKDVTVQAAATPEFKRAKPSRSGRVQFVAAPEAEHALAA